MTEAEDRLRAWLGRRAELAPRGQFMLDRVRRESARRTRRHRAALGGGLALAAVMSVLVVATLTGWSRPGPPSVTGDNGVVFVAGAPVRATFPLGLAAGFNSSTPVGTLVGGRPTLVLPSLDPPQASLTITVGTAPPPADAKPVKIGTGPAAMALNGTRGADGYTVWWTAPTGGWATVSVPPDYPFGLLLKLVAAFGTGQVPGAEPFTFATVPRGFVVDNIDSSHVTFCPPGTTPGPASAGKILVRFDRGPLTGPGQHVTVAGRAGLLAATSAGTVLRVAVSAGVTLSVEVPSTIHLARADLLRFAAGIRPTGRS